jgi:hypothetical protein
MLRIKSTFIAIGLFVIAMTIHSCTKPDVLGLDLQPADEQPGITKTDTFTINSYVVNEDSLLSWSTVKNSFEPPSLFLGSLNDPFIGQSYGGFVAQIRIGNTITSSTFKGVTSPDSVVLSFGYKSVTGDTSAVHHISAYELTEDLHGDSVYYTARTYAKGNVLGHVDVVPNFKDSVMLFGVNRSPQLRIPLDNSFGAKLMQEYISNPSTFASNTSFNNYFKGIVMVDSADGIGSMLTLQSLSSLNRLTIYYSGSSYEFIIDGNSVRMSYFKHNYLSSNTDAVSDNQLVVQSMAGLKDSIVIPYLRNLYDGGKVSISNAQLVIKLQTGGATTGFTPHTNLLVFASDSLGRNVTIADASESASGYYGGVYNEANQEYRFNIARHMQRTLIKIVDKGEKDYGLFLVAGGSTSNAQRTILQGNAAIKLIITYTKVNP